MGKGNYCQPGILCIAKLPFKIHVDTNILSRHQKLREFITSRSQIRMQKGVFPIEEKWSQMETWKWKGMKSMEKLYMYIN